MRSETIGSKELSEFIEKVLTYNACGILRNSAYTRCRIANYAMVEKSAKLGNEMAGRFVREALFYGEKKDIVSVTCGAARFVELSVSLICLKYINKKPT